MLFRREILSSFKATNAQNITRIWASDGWCYIPQFGERQKFIDHSPNVFQIITEKWDGIIPSQEYVEQVQYSLITKTPLIWIEKTLSACEKFEETTEYSNT